MKSTQITVPRETTQAAKYFIRCFHLFRNLQRKKEYLARKLIGFSSDQMYLVVADVKHYKQFLPFCTKSIILKQEPKELETTLEIGFPPIIENYTLTVSLDRPTLVHAVCNDGRLFHYLETTWRFSPGLRSNSKSCIIDFYIKFEFKSVLCSRLASMFFDILAEQMENAFINEAKRRYGQESVLSSKLSSVKS